MAIRSDSGTNGYDAIVVGGGHNGLTAAAYLARAGNGLLLERRDTLGGCCVTEEIAPGCRASTTSYMASMLRPEVIRDLNLKRTACAWSRATRWSRCPSSTATSSSWWSDSNRLMAELRRHSARDADTFARVDGKLKQLARYLQPFFLEPPPDVHATGLASVGRRAAGRKAVPQDQR